MTKTEAKKTAPAAEATTAAEPAPAIRAIKGFDKDLKCRGLQFETGKTYTHPGKVKACHSGFHAITGHPLAVFGYYAPAGSRFCRVEIFGEMHSDDDEKTAAEIIKIGAEIGKADLTSEAVKWVFDRAKWSEGPVATGANEGATARGYQGAATASGYQGAATASGDQGAATASGTQGAATASGYQGAATASGTRGAATASGYQGAATASGYQGAATASGVNCGAYATGFFGKVSGVDGSPLHLDRRIYNPGGDDHGRVTHVWAGIVGRDGIEPDTFYTIDEAGQAMKVDA